MLIKKNYRCLTKGANNYASEKQGSETFNEYGQTRTREDKQEEQRCSGYDRQAVIRLRQHAGEGIAEEEGEEVCRLTS